MVVLPEASESKNGVDENVSKKDHLTQNDVLQAAARLMRKHGYYGTSIQMIASELGISKSTFFHHMKSKQDMLFQILNVPMQKVYPGLLSIYVQEISCSKKLELAVINHIVNLHNNSEIVGVLLQERDSLETPYKEILDPQRDDYERTFCRIIEDGIASGEFRHDRPRIVALAILGMCNWLIQWYKPGGELSAQEIGEMFADFALRLVRPQSV